MLTTALLYVPNTQLAWPPAREPSETEENREIVAGLMRNYTKQRATYNSCLALQLVHGSTSSWWSRHKDPLKIKERSVYTMRLMLNMNGPLLICRPSDHL